MKLRFPGGIAGEEPRGEMASNAVCLTVLVVGLASVLPAAFGGERGPIPGKEGPVASEGKPGRGVIPVGKPMHFSIGNDVALQRDYYESKKQDETLTRIARIAAGAEKAKVTAFEPYVKWMLLEPAEGKWDFSFYDQQVATYKKHGIRWVPFMIAGPAYATPAWFKKSPESVFAKCLEHGETTRTQSIWNPHLPARIERLVKAFADHYDHADIQALLLGISGDFGETIYTVSGNSWTYIWDGEYHHHRGWWCGDAHAEKDFRETLRAKYATIEQLNAAWNTKHAGFEEIRPFIPDGGHSRRARLDMTRWYRGAMTRFAGRWLDITRKHLPDVPVLLCTGGDGQPAIGADFSEQGVMAAERGCGIRITNEASDYARNFVITRWVGSACRNLGTYFGYEPAGAVDERGIVARIYNATASGADELFVYDNPPAGPRGAVYAKYHHLLVKRKPSVPVAVFLSKTSQELGRPLPARLPFPGLLGFRLPRRDADREGVPGPLQDAGLD
jgi:hypothetical protein